MSSASDSKIVLVVSTTRLDELIARYNTISQAQFYIEHMGVDFSDYLNEDKEYKNSVKKAKQILNSLGRLQVVQRDFLPNFIFGKNDTVVAIGRDGLVANTLKYLKNQPLIGINPDPKRWDGVLLPFQVPDLSLIIPELRKSNRPIKEVTMAKASLNDGQTLLAVNDFFIGQKTHLSARYELTLGNQTEKQSSSGIIVSTGLGSTGWLQSVLAGAQGVTKKLEGKTVRKIQKSPKSLKKNNSKIQKSSYEFSLPWDTNCLQFSVREPFPSRTSGTSLVFGEITQSKPLTILSQMPENGVIFSDGIESDFLSFTSGMVATINLAENRGKLVV